MPRYFASIGYATRNGFYRKHRMEVEAPDIGAASLAAGDHVRRDRRRQVRDVKDIEVVLMKGDA
jgi:hypothetical protein